MTIVKFIVLRELHFNSMKRHMAGNSVKRKKNVTFSRLYIFDYQEKLRFCHDNSIQNQKKNIKISQILTFFLKFFLKFLQYMWKNKFFDTVIQSLGYIPELL